MEIGKKIKDYRLKMSLTQEELADRCELTKGYISQLENDLTSPSIDTLNDILIALGTTFSEFFEDDDQKIVFTDNDYIEKENANSKITWVIPSAQKNSLEPIILELEPHTKSQEYTPYEGEEFGYVMEGNIVLHIGIKTLFVCCGESFYFRADKIHYIENLENKRAKIIWISTPPNF